MDGTQTAFSNTPNLNTLAYLNQNEPLQALTVPAKRDPTTSDKKYRPGTIWRNIVDKNLFILVLVDSAGAQWNALSGGSADIIAKSVTSPAGFDLSLNAASGQDVNIKSGDAAGANYINFLDSASSVVARMSSDGEMDAQILSAETVKTNFADYLQMEGDAISALGTSSNISVRLNSKGNGSIYCTSGQLILNESSASSVSATVSNQSTGTAYMRVYTEGASDAYFAMEHGEDAFWAIGEEATTHDFVIANGTDLGSSQVMVVTDSTNEISFNTPTLKLPSAGAILAIKANATGDSLGSATLSSGTVTVANTNIQGGDFIFVTYNGTSLTNTGSLSTTKNAGNSFTIESTNGSDANIVVYLILRAAT